MIAGANALPETVVRQIPPPPQLQPPEDAWAAADIIQIAAFRPESSDHRPATTLRLLHDGEHLYGRFTVQDYYVRSRHTQFGDPVYRDSCVEIFLQPRPDRGYFNFEFNAGGTMMCCYITNPERVGATFKEYRKWRPEDARGLQIHASLPPVVEPEQVGPLTWWLTFALPVRLLEPFVGPLGPLAGQCWRMNAYKCGNETSHPHWAAWAPVDALNFHLPRCFGKMHWGG
ncbi:carbohydrate-binding family 9-like protein [Fontisphaera persica]|uniref:carbohydrate-binding family 9-like protein n=1 Tax=Fontisphaera persica TaxID=2974023 RepID=UPI0024C0B2CA|nr:carbohydrate-binding family 9-like protein [Fontisphaera persica]WCJ58654.1 carbohydrate-binding family 9-like protein [Fontisphaera persica]